MELLKYKLIYSVTSHHCLTKTWSSTVLSFLSPVLCNKIHMVLICKNNIVAKFSWLPWYFNLAGFVEKCSPIMQYKSLWNSCYTKRLIFETQDKDITCMAPESRRSSAVTSSLMNSIFVLGFFIYLFIFCHSWTYSRDWSQTGNWGCWLRIRQRCGLWSAAGRPCWASARSGSRYNPGHGGWCNWSPAPPARQQADREGIN